MPCGLGKAATTCCESLENATKRPSDEQDGCELFLHAAQAWICAPSERRLTSTISSGGSELHDCGAGGTRAAIDESERRPSPSRPEHVKRIRVPPDPRCFPH